MAKRSGNKNNSKQFNSIKTCDNKALSVVNDNVLQSLEIRSSNHDDKMSQKIGLIKSESAPLLIDHKGYEYTDNVPEYLVNGNEKVVRPLKKQPKIIDEIDEISTCSAIRLSHFVIVDSVLKETNINLNIEAQLPASLNIIYQKFINSKQYIDNFQTKDQFYRGVGLLGIGVEERIYNKRKALEESIKRGFRLRPNPKPRRQFDGTIINRPLKNRNKFSFIKNNSDKLKYNVFTIGNDLLNKNHRCPLRKTIKKKSVMRRAAAQKLELAKKALNEACVSTDDDTTDDHKVSIALSRTKRQPKVPQLDFKYCYSEGFGVRTRKNVDSCKEDQFMEIVDSDSSSVVEVFPPGDKENSEYSDECVSHRRSSHQTLSSSKCLIGSRKGWRPQENKALNLLDKLRLGLQCTVIQTERDVIIQNLTLEDLSTLRSRLQGLATFKNIEAEYDKNGQETARATIDRKVLNIPFKGYDSQLDQRFSSNITKKGEESLKRKIINSSIDKKKQITPVKDMTNSNVKVEDFCSTWVRPKVRSVKKIRKLYTQCASTPNILARSQGSNRPETSQTSNRSSSTKSQSTIVESNSNSQHSSIAPVSFYPQISSASSNTITDSLIDSKPNKSETFSPSISVTESSTPVETSTTSVLSLARNVTTTSSQSLADSSKKLITTIAASQSSNGTPATAMSASQLLMLRKGGGQATSDSGTPFSSTISMSGNDQIFTNQILKPFKKTIPSSSPAKLEIDEEEVEFELTPSIIAQAKAIDVHVNSNCSPVNSPVKTPFLSKPLIQPTGILVNCRRTLHLSNNPLFQTHNSIPITAPISSTVLFTCSKLPILEASALNSLISVPNVPNPDVVHTAVIKAPNDSNDNVQNTVTNPKIKHRKWTHNFLTSNSINFREVLCSVAPKNVPIARAPLPVTLSPPSTASVSATCTTIASKPLLIPNVIVSTVASPIKCSLKPISVPAKGSSVVLKSLLVGSNSSIDLCNLNKSPIWTSKYLATNANSHDSKIKWQVGGSFVPNQTDSVASVSKENKSIDALDTTDSK